MLFQARAFGDESHRQKEEATASEKQIQVVSFDKIIKWVGNFHLILLHFPIALITMAAVSELLFFLVWKFFVRSGITVHGHSGSRNGHSNCFDRACIWI